MGWVTAMVPCIRCDRIFACNPHRVPSTSALTGKREAICRPCVEAINAKRVELGIDEFEIPDDAYDPIREEEL